MTVKAGPGRPRGARNRITTEIKEQITCVYYKIGGPENFAKWARTHESEFYKIWANLAPKEVKADITVHDESTLSDAELEHIATGGSDGVAEAAEGSQVLN